MNQCTCIYAPMGDHGLEGFILNEVYDYEQKENRFIVHLDPEPFVKGVMSRTTFNKYFRKGK